MDLTTDPRDTFFHRKKNNLSIRCLRCKCKKVDTVKEDPKDESWVVCGSCGHEVDHMGPPTYGPDDIREDLWFRGWWVGSSGNVNIMTGHEADGK